MVFIVVMKYYEGLRLIGDSNCELPEKNIYVN